MRFVGLVGPTKVYNGNIKVTTPGTAVQFPDLEVLAVSICAGPGNVGNVGIGGADVAFGSWRTLEPGASIDIAIDNLNRLWVDADNADDSVSYLAVA